MRRLAVICCCAGVAVSLSGEQPAPTDAPLSGTKQQLQALKRDEAAQKTGTPAGVQLNLPSVNAPDLTTDLGLTKPKKEDGAETKRNARRKNWLLDGYDKLDRKKTGGAADAHDRKEGEGLDEQEEKLDPKDPDYFLRVYERQRAESEAKQLELKSAQAETADAKLLGGGAADPFAPFMKEWLANSPVREALRETGTVEGSTAGAAAPVGHSPTTETTLAGASVLSGDANRDGGANPFLQSLGLVAAEAKSGEMRAPVAQPVIASSLDNRLPPATTQPATAERVRSDSRNAVPPPPEDKKYFPQLKKF